MVFLSPGRFRYGNINQNHVPLHHRLELCWMMATFGSSLSVSPGSIVSLRIFWLKHSLYWCHSLGTCPCGFLDLGYTILIGVWFDELMPRLFSYSIHYSLFISLFSFSTNKSLYLLTWFELRIEVFIWSLWIRTILLLHTLLCISSSLSD